MAGTASDFANTIEKWWAQPFNAQGSAFQWFLFLGLLIIIVVAWNQILRFILEE
jgi:hypothetical protein